MAQRVHRDEEGEAVGETNSDQLERSVHVAEGQQ
jgi:hypothetical protein